jgi:hypothetical protein
MHGIGEFSWFDVGECYVGDFVQNAMTGMGIRDCSNGCVVGAFVDGRICGWATKEYKNQDVYSGFWKEDQKHGWGEYCWTSNGERYTGMWEGTSDPMPVLRVMHC